MSTSEATQFSSFATRITPLTFDRVSGGRTILSPFPLFQLPIELFSHVTPYFTSSDLACLSLVDRDCCNLARTIQFADVRLDYSQDALDFLAERCREMEIHDSSGSVSVNSCIRRLVINTNKRLARRRHSTELVDLISLHVTDRYSRIKEAEKAEMDYYQSICRLVECGLPNIHVLDWASDSLLTHDMRNCLANSPVKHLRLNHFIITGDGACIDTVDQPWSLETLVLNFSPIQGDSVNQEAPERFVRNILFRSAPTLRRLGLKGVVDVDGSTGPGMFTLPFLTGLIFESTPGQANLSMVSSLLRETTTIRSLSVDTSTTEVSEYIRFRGCIPTLYSFTWINSLDSNHENVLSFIHENPQLRSFDSTWSLPSLILDLRLLPILSMRTHNLTALHLSWEVASLPDESIRLIGTITSLKHLWLSAGAICDWRHGWGINHEHLLGALKTLVHLESLIFSRDSYRVANVHPLLDPSVSGYFINKVLPQDVQFSDYLSDSEIAILLDDDRLALTAPSSMMTILWERWHKRRMLSIGSQYAEVFLNLTWCFIGQLEMGVVSSNDLRTVVVVEDSRRPYLEPVMETWDRIRNSF